MLYLYHQGFHDRGVAVDAITLQNEPLHSSDWAWTMKMVRVLAVASYAASSLFTETYER